MKHVLGAAAAIGLLSALTPLSAHAEGAQGDNGDRRDVAGAADAGKHGGPQYKAGSSKNGVGAKNNSAPQGNSGQARFNKANGATFPGAAATARRHNVQTGSASTPFSYGDRAAGAQIRAQSDTRRMARPAPQIRVPPTVDRSIAADRTFQSNGLRRSADISSLRRNVESQHRFRVAPYREPYGYSQQRWTYGDRLPRAYFARDYWITNYLIYALFAPPADLMWVRVGYDALLIDENTGEIIQVEYDVFY